MTLPAALSFDEANQRFWWADSGAGGQWATDGRIESCSSDGSDRRVEQDLDHSPTDLVVIGRYIYIIQYRYTYIFKYRVIVIGILNCLRVYRSRALYTAKEYNIQL